MPGLTTPELRARAVLNFYTAERRKHVPPDTAWDRSQEFGRDLDRIAERIQNDVAKIMAEG
jgi:sugar phosphate isomerase/epimerase